MSGTNQTVSAKALGSAAAVDPAGAMGAAGVVGSAAPAGFAASAGTAASVSAAASVGAGTAGAPASHSPQLQQYLTFRLGGEVFALGILAIKEIIEYTGCTPVPMAPSHIRGVINLRGSAVSVADLRVRFGAPPSQVTKKTCVVIVECRVGDTRQDVGLIVDAVDAVVEIQPADIDPPPSFGAAVPQKFIAGMARIGGGGFVIVLNVDDVLSPADERSMASAA